MKPGRGDVVHVIAEVYRASAVPERWGGALAAVAALLGSPAAVLERSDPGTGRIQIAAHHGLPAGLAESYNQQFIEADELIAESLRRPAGMILSTELVLPEGDHGCSTLFRNLLAPAGLSGAWGAVLLKEECLYAALWLGWTGTGACHNVSARESLRQLLPHLAQAVAVSHRVVRAERFSALAAGAFDRLASGVILLDADGRPLLVNREARRIVEKDDGLSIHRDRLVATTHANTQLLQELIAQAGRRDAPRRRRAERALRLSRPSGRPDYQVIALPLPRRCQPNAEGTTVAVLFIADPERSHHTTERLARDLFGLTVAEGRLLMELLSGSNLTEAAEALDLSRNTVHSQLSCVFRKTGARRQSELVGLVLRAVAPVRGSEDSSGIFVPMDLTS